MPVMAMDYFRLPVHLWQYLCDSPGKEKEPHQVILTVYLTAPKVLATSLSRQLAQFIVKLKYQDLPPEIVDKAKALTLQALASALAGSQWQGPKQTIRMIKQEEAVARGGSTILVDGAMVTKAGAAFTNSELISAAGKLDSFQMLTHPSLTILPGALAVVEEAGSTGKEFITAIVAGYEVMERLSKDFVPAVVARGFHSGPVFGIFGATVAAGKLMNLNEDQMNSAIALSVNLSGGNLEGGMHGGRVIHQNGAARNAMLAVLLAKDGIKGAETVLEGNAGFYHSYTGNNKGKLTYSFGRKTTNFDKITAGLGSEWVMMNTIHRIYSISGTNIGPIEVTAKLCVDNNIRPQDVERVEAVVHWLELYHPSPAFPGAERGVERGAHYFIAHSIVKRSYPVLVKPGQQEGPMAADALPDVLKMMKKVSVVGSKTQTLFGPKITIFTKNGKSYTANSKGKEFMFDLKETIKRIQELVPAMPISASQYNQLVTAVSGLDKLPRADKLIQLTCLKK